MFDKITIRAKVSGEECVHLAQLHHLQVWTNEAGTQVDYRSSEYSKISGIDVKIQRNTVTLKTSLHKYWNNRNYGRLRNDNIFTLSEAKAAFEMLLFENGLTQEKTRIVQFEVGLNMHVSYDPLTFIEMVQFISFRNKLMFVDANFKINRQRTTEKHRDIRKYYKIYDKGWEMKEKKRGASSIEHQASSNEHRASSIESRQDHILRIETVYRRHNERSDKFFRDENLNRLVKRFYVDWKDLFFFRTVRAYKGARKSEVERASIIINYGAEEYLQRTKKEFEARKITAKQYRTIREFIRDYEEDSKRFKTMVSEQEKEYNSLLYNVFDITRK